MGADIGSLEITLAIRDTDQTIRFDELKLTDARLSMVLGENLRGRVLPSVGNGSWRLSDTFQKQHGVLIEKHREPVCIWTAIDYILSFEGGDVGSAYRFSYQNDLPAARYPISSPYPSSEAVERLMTPVSLRELTNSFPILLVNVKTGTSFYKMNSPTEFTRVGGSSIGASTTMALGKSLVGKSSLSSMLQAARALEKPSSADLLVEDIYGGDCVSIGLPGSIIASCLGKAHQDARDSPDLSKSLLDMICINTAQLAYLHAGLHKCRTVLIVGSVGEEPVLSECIQRVLHILSGQKHEPLRAIFLKQSRHLGSLGALLRRETLLRELSVPNVPMNTATVADGVHDETYTKLRVGTSPKL